MVRKKCYLLFILCIIIVVILINELFLFESSNSSSQHRDAWSSLDDTIREKETAADDWLRQPPPPHRASNQVPDQMIDENDLKLKLINNNDARNYLDDSDDHIMWFVHVSASAIFQLNYFTNYR